MMKYQFIYLDGRNWLHKIPLASVDEALSALVCLKAISKELRMIF